MTEQPIQLGDEVRLVLNDEKGPLNRVIAGRLVMRKRLPGDTHGTVWLAVDGSMQSYGDTSIKELRHAHEGADTQAAPDQATAPTG